MKFGGSIIALSELAALCEQYFKAILSFIFYIFIYIYIGSSSIQTSYEGLTFRCNLQNFMAFLSGVAYWYYL